MDQLLFIVLVIRQNYVNLYHYMEISETNIYLLCKIKENPQFADSR